MAERDESDSEMGDAGDLVETLVAGRQRRRTAGNRLHHVLQEEADDEVTLLFAEEQGEGDEDVDFESNGSAASDDDLDQSESSDGETPGAGPDGGDYSGERALKENEKAERAKQRRRQKPWDVSRALRNKAQKASHERGDVEEMESQPAKTPKAAARSLNANDGPVRSSSRKHTKLNTELVNQRAQQSEEQRKRHVKSLEAAAKLKNASKAKAMTQADRLAEAARVERHNSKSLNRWEAAESRRLEEQRAKFAALRNRQLDGPVMTWWSGPSTWSGETLVATGAANVKLQQRVSAEPGHMPSGKNGTLESFRPSEKGEARPTLGSLHGSGTPAVDAASQPPLNGLQPTSLHHVQVDITTTAQRSEDNSKSLAEIPQPRGGDAALEPQTHGIDKPSFAQPETQTAARNLLILKNFEGAGAKTAGLQAIFAQRKRGTALRPASTSRPCQKPDSY